MVIAGPSWPPSSPTSAWPWPSSSASWPPGRSHPFGFGGERYFWSFVVALVLFTGGGLFALFEAEEKLRRPHEVGSPGWAIAILGVAFVLESLSLRTARRAELPVVLLEDTGALLGLSFALAGVVLAAAVRRAAPGATTYVEPTG